MPLVPALMSLLGRRNWWFPAWAARILRADVEIRALAVSLG
jgi:uncharacterized membrane protein YdfJ with MMPL/SSD domain